MGDITQTQMPAAPGTAGQPIVLSRFAPRTAFNPESGLPSYYQTVGAPLDMGQQFGVGEAKPLAEEIGAERKEVYQQIEIDAQRDAAARNAAEQARLEQAAGLTPTSAANNAAASKSVQGTLFGLPVGMAALQQVGQVKDRIANGLIAAGLIMIVLAGLGIWLGAAGVQNALAIRRAEKSGEPLPKDDKYSGIRRAAMGASIAAVVLGSIGLFLSLLSALGGQPTGGLLYGLLMAGLLIVGAIAINKLRKNDKGQGFWAHFASGLWIATMVVMLLLPGVGALALGSWLK